MVYTIIVKGGRLMNEKFLDTPAGDAWISYLLSPTLERSADLANLLEQDKSRSNFKDLELE